MEDFLDTSEWVPIHTLPGYECCIEYFVNRQGDVMSTKGSKPKILKPTIGFEGYKVVGLQQRLGRKQKKTVAVHKLVAFAFLPPPPLPYGNKRGCCNIDHDDENKLNNNVDNLFWSTPGDNNSKPGYKRGYGKINSNPTEKQLKHRKVCKNFATRVAADEAKLAKRRKYHRERARHKRALEKQAKIEISNDEK